jgi:hypothetical protein
MIQNPDGGIYFVPMYLRERVVTITQFINKRLGNRLVWFIRVIAFLPLRWGSVILGSVRR